MPLSRRTLLASSIAAALSDALPACRQQTTDSDRVAGTSAVSNQSAEAQASLNEATKLLVNAYPETASSAGIDHGKYAQLKSLLTDPSPAGQAQIENDVRKCLKNLTELDASALPPDVALDIDVVRTMFEATVHRFDFDFGDNAMLNLNWSYRPSPYVVAQNTGAFVEIPSFLGFSQNIDSSDDTAAFLIRLEAYAGQLDGETERVLRDGAKGKIAPALLRQVNALSSFRPTSNADAGIWAKPRGDEYYAWALRAGTTTNLSPDEVHQMGLDELAALQARMEPILGNIGYTKGTVGELMTALGSDPRFHFFDGDKGRAEIMAFIEDALVEIRALMPQEFETLVPGFLEVTRISPDVEAGAYGGAGSIDGTEPRHF